MQREKELVRRAQQGDREAFAVLYEEHFEGIYRYIFVRIRDQAEAEDLTQQVFLAALEALPSYRWRGVPFSSWLFRIAHNRVVDYMRKATKFRSSPTADLAPAESDPAAAVEREMELAQLAELLEELTPLQQEVVSLRFSGGLSTAEVAKVMGKSEGAIKALQHSALVALRKKLEAGEHGKEI